MRFLIPQMFGRCRRQVAATVLVILLHLMTYFNNFVIASHSNYPDETSPKNITNFSCKGYDYEYMTCNFTKPKDMIFTDYELKYSTDSDNLNYSYQCKLRTTYEYVYCNITANEDRVYLPSRDVYYFNLTANNSQGSISQFFAINNHKNVIPGKLQIKIGHATSDSVTLYWRMVKISYYKEHGLEYEIRLRPNGFDWYNVTDFNHCNSAICNLVLKNLKYPNREYDISVRVKVKTARNDGTMWSEPYIGRFVTESRRPDYPPKIAVGSFYIDSTESNVQLYWKQLAEYEENGPGFHYRVEEIDSNGNIINNMTSNQSSIIIPYQNKRRITYYISSSNDVGNSLDKQSIQIFPTTSKDNDRFAPHTIASIYNNSTYTLSWKAPLYKSELSNYTVFWCLSKMELPNQCKGTIHFQYLDKFQTNFTTSPQDQTLNLAIAANYPNYSSGMRWAICSADVTSALMKLEPEVSAISAHAIKIQWSTQRVCTSILKGYNITYCQMAENSVTDSQTNCTTPMKTITCPSDLKQFVIGDLKPFSTYRINILMYSETKVGPPSSTMVVRTKESAPSAPRDLKVDLSTVTTNSVNISWLPPVENNGHLQYYIVWKTRLQKKINTDYQKVFINETSIKLESLNSFSEYEVYITAHTIEASVPSNRIRFSTLIGVPTNPQKVTIKEYENYNELQWLEPEMPSGRVEFYVVSLLIKYKKGVSVSEDEKIALVKGNTCQFQFPKCIGPIDSYQLRVRAVNVAYRDEIDGNLFPTSETFLTNKWRRHTNPKISNVILEGLQTENVTPLYTGKYDSSDHYDTYTKYSLDGTTRKKFAPLLEKESQFDTTTDNDFICTGNDPVEKRYHVYTNQVNNAIYSDNGEDFTFFYSPWQNLTNIYKCSEYNFVRYTTIPIAILFIAALLGLVSVWLRYWYNKMKNIEAVLPEGLMDHLPNYKFSINSTPISANIYYKEPSLNSNTYLLHHNNKESHYLLSTVSNTASEQPSSIALQNAQPPESLELNHIENNLVSQSPLQELNTMPNNCYCQPPPHAFPIDCNSYVHPSVVAAMNGKQSVTSMAPNEAVIFSPNDGGSNVSNNNNNNNKISCGYVSQRQFAGNNGIGVMD